MSVEPLRVVVAEDESIIRMDLVEMLEGLGCEVVGEAADGDTALALTLALTPDVVLLDVEMPVKNGLQVAEELLHVGDSAIVMLTAYSQPELVARAAEAGAMAYLVKPVTPTDILPALEVARSRFAQLRALQGRVTALEDKLETRKIVDRAKGVLQSQHGLDEAAAFRWLQKAAMDQRRPMRDVAQALIASAQG